MYGSRKCNPVRRNSAAAWAAANMEGTNDAEEDGRVHGTITVATNGPTGKRRTPRVVQETS